MVIRARERAHAADLTLSAELTTVRDAALEAVKRLGAFWASLKIGASAKTPPLRLGFDVLKLRGASRRLTEALESPAVDSTLNAFHIGGIEAAGVSDHNYARALLQLCGYAIRPLQLAEDVDFDAVLKHWSKLKKEFASEVDDLLAATAKLRIQIEDEFDRALNSIAPPLAANGQPADHTAKRKMAIGQLEILRERLDSRADQQIADFDFRMVETTDGRCVTCLRELNLPSKGFADFLDLQTQIRKRLGELDIELNDEQDLMCWAMRYAGHKRAAGPEDQICECCPECVEEGEEPLYPGEPHMEAATVSAFHGHPYRFMALALQMFLTTLKAADGASGGPIKLRGRKKAKNGPKPEAQDDGPEAPNWFWWKGEKREFQPIPHRLLTYLWDSADGKPTVEHVIERVWEADTTEGNLRATISRLNTALAEHGFPITANLKNGYVSLTVGNS